MSFASKIVALWNLLPIAAKSLLIAKWKQKPLCLLFIFGWVGANSTYLGLTQLPFLKKMPNSGSPTTVKPSRLTQRDGPMAFLVNSAAFSLQFATSRSCASEFLVDIYTLPIRPSNSITPHSFCGISFLNCRG